MLLFSDGFETYNIYDIRYKWGQFGSQDYPPVAKIVSGTDTSINKPWATKGGRALYLANRPFDLGTVFRPSRTIFTGFAFRATVTTSTHYSDISLHFATQLYMRRMWGDRLRGNVSPDIQWRTDPSPRAGKLDLRIYKYYVNYTWTFTGTGLPTQVGRIDTPMDMLSGDFHYIQAGMTLHGNVSALPQAWCELRIGNRASGFVQHQNILTSTPDDLGYFFMNGLSFVFNGPGYNTVDDVYIANDEGSYNNTFLGNVKVRRVTPSANGSDNASVPTLKSGDAVRFQAVDEDFAGSNSLPSPIPTEDPLFIAWEPQFEDYLTLEQRGDRQSLRLHSVPFDGSSPRIHGAVLHVLAKSSEMGIGGQSVLKGYRRLGLLPLAESNPADIPLTFLRPDGGTWQTFPLAFDNQETVAEGQPAIVWSTSAVNDSEWVIELADSEIDPAMIDQNLVRFNLEHDEVIEEYLAFVEWAHRFYEEPVSESIAMTETQLLYEWTFKAEDQLYWSPEIAVYRTFRKSLNDQITFAEIIPWTYLFGQDTMAIADELFLQWHDQVSEEVTFADWSAGFWEELFNDAVELGDSIIASYIELLDEALGLEEPYLWDGHEDVEESLGIEVDYLWSGHELLEETLYSDDQTINAFGLDIEDGFELIEDHFDGWLVEQPSDPLGLAVSVLTQHWRYERLFGIVISSWQVSPVEQQGNDGDHTGDNPEGW